jgi:hypothetical protein
MRDKYPLHLYYVEWKYDGSLKDFYTPKRCRKIRVGVPNEDARSLGHAYGGRSFF